MEQFIDFINSDTRIIKILCKMRAKQADERHKKHLLNDLSPDIPIEINRKMELESLLPSRRQWLSLYEKNRFKTYRTDNGQIYKQKITSFETNSIRIQKTVESALKRNASENWVRNLQDFIKDVRCSLLDSAFKLTTPITYPISKNKRNKEGFEECRPISIFQLLKDKVIISLVNQYLTILFDPFFYTESLAFRSQRAYHQHKSGYVTTHHDAIDRINEYRSNHESNRIFVAECDMQKFYDSVNHGIIRREFKKLILLVRQKNPELDTEIPARIFYSYLDCYSFPQQVYKLNNDKSYWVRQKKIRNGRFEWIEKQLIENKICKSSKSINRLRIGIPQGGALSGLISSIVLNAADKAVRKYNGDYLYLRYCDDMILMHTNKDTCSKILGLYESSLRKLKLIPHKFETELPFRTARFWECKSKPVYEWNYDTGSDWVGFVGYEMKRTGEIRIRRKSLMKEKLKQKKVVKDICREVVGKRRVSNYSVENSIRHKLICMSIGRVTLWNFESLRNELCWINGFKNLHVNKHATQQIQMLDKARNYTIYKACKFLNDAQAKSRQQIIERKNKATEITQYYGIPFSYYYHYLKNCQK